MVAWSMPSIACEILVLRSPLEAEEAGEGGTAARSFATMSMPFILGPENGMGFWYGWQFKARKHEIAKLY